MTGADLRLPCVIDEVGNLYNKDSVLQVRRGDGDRGFMLCTSLCPGFGLREVREAGHWE